MKCSNCGTELTENMFISGMCFVCANPISESEKIFDAEQAEIAAQKIQNQKDIQEKLQKERFFQEQERQKLQAEQLENHYLTTGYNFEDFSIKKYLGIVSGEMIIGTGWISNLSADISDFFGGEAYQYVEKIKLAKEIATQRMIADSISKGGNAIIGISYSFYTLSRDLIGVSVNGTSVTIDKKDFQ